MNDHTNPSWRDNDWHDSHSSPGTMSPLRRARPRVLRWRGAPLGPWAGEPNWFSEHPPRENPRNDNRSQLDSMDDEPHQLIVEWTRYGRHTFGVGIERTSREFPGHVPRFLLLASRRTPLRMTWYGRWTAISSADMECDHSTYTTPRLIASQSQRTLWEGESGGFRGQKAIGRVGEYPSIPSTARGHDRAPRDWQKESELEDGWRGIKRDVPIASQLCDAALAANARG